MAKVKRSDHVAVLAATLIGMLSGALVWVMTGEHDYAFVTLVIVANVWHAHFAR